MLHYLGFLLLVELFSISELIYRCVLKLLITLTDVVHHEEVIIIGGAGSSLVKVLCSLSNCSLEFERVLGLYVGVRLFLFEILIWLLKYVFGCNLIPGILVRSSQIKLINTRVFMLVKGCFIIEEVIVIMCIDMGFTVNIAFNSVDEVSSRT